MSQRTIRFCDECQADHTTINGWFSAIIAPSTPTFTTYEVAEQSQPQHPVRFDYCSQKCVTTAFQRWLDTGSIAKPETK